MDYRLLTVSACDITAGKKLFKVKDIVDDPDLLKVQLAQISYDFVILPYSEQTFRVAAACVKNSYTVFLLLCEPEEFASASARCFPAGILITAKNKLSGMLGPMIAQRVRLSRYENERSILKQQLDDTKILNRAKLLLMTRLNMSEPEAHRYLEKTAMDTSGRIRDVSLNIIRTYEE